MMKERRKRTVAKLKVVPLGNGLFQVGSDIVCTFPLLGTTPGKTSMVYHYAEYDITVLWEIGEDGISRIHPSWTRTKKSQSGGASE